MGTEFKPITVPTGKVKQEDMPTMMVNALNGINQLGLGQNTMCKSVNGIEKTIYGDYADPSKGLVSKVTAIETHNEDIEKQVDGNTKFKNRMIWYLIGGGSILGVAGGLVSQYLFGG